MTRSISMLFAAALLLASQASYAGSAAGPGNTAAESAPGAAENGTASVGASTSGTDGNPRVQKINQYALRSTPLIRQMLSDAKGI